MPAQVRPPITDSPWFWVFVFSLMALAALAAIGGKYGRRQAGVERKYQVAERIAAGEIGLESESQTADRRTYASPDDTLIPLWPLTLVLSVIALVAGAMLWHSRRTTVSAPRNTVP